MKKYISALFLGVSLVGLTSCEDFLDRQPESSLTGEGFFNTAAELATYAIKYYTMFPADCGYTYGNAAIDNGTDNQVSMSASSRYIPGEWKVGNGAWSFTTIRQINYFFNMVQEKYDNNQISGSVAEINQYMGEMHFFRAYAFWDGYVSYGDYPIYTVLPSENKEELLELSKRKPRNQVARFILDELQQAINLLPETSTYGKQGLNKDCARLFRSRVALFEGTWLKYHKGTALVPGGPGWPGDKADLGSDFNIDNEISYFFTEAKNSAKPLADKIYNNLVENTDTPEGMDAKLNSINPYYTMFCDQNMDGYSEVLLWKKMDFELKVTSNVQMQMMRNGGNTGWTRGMVNSFLMRNGLPIYAAGSGYDSDWENEGVTASLQDRDSRIQIFTKGDNSVDYYYNEEPTMWREGWLLDGGGDGTRAVTGYCIKKGKHYNGAWAGSHNVGLNGTIIFRATEALLNYMEADCEAGDGRIDQNSENYWAALRNRAKVDPDFNKTINATNMSEEAKWDWGAYSAGNLIGTTLYNIRRERRNELCAEGLRLNDLRRWAAMDQLITNKYQIEGVKYWGTVYSDPNSPFCLKTEAGVFLAATVDVAGGTGTMSSQTISGDYVRPFQITQLQNLAFDGLTFIQAHYLSPIPQKSFSNASPDETLANSVIYQNPGWPKVSGQSALDAK